jgi:hypothetical protein
MLIKPGLAVSEMSGKFGGVVAAHNRGGQYFRQFRVPTDPSSERQQQYRGYMAAANVAWKALTQAQRDAWDAYAANTPWRNKLGDTIYLTGFQWFVRSEVIAKAALAAGASVVADPQLCTASGGLPDQLEFTTVSIGVAAGASIGYNDGDVWPDEDGACCVVYMSRPRPATQVFDGAPSRLLCVIEGNAVTPPTSPETIVTASLPWTIVEGQLTTLYARILRADGTLSEPIKQNVTIVA